MRHFLHKPDHWPVPICAALALLTFALYWPLKNHFFIELDDAAYITDNPHVNEGLSWAGIVWAFHSGYAANWHPLTWISHMLDCQLYALSPAGHHLTNLLFHIANTLLLFVWLSRLTHTLWRSALVAALFAWHPLHVESVAWAAERKDVLSAFFWMLTLIAYTRYARGATNDTWQVTRNLSILPPVTAHRLLYYWLALFFFACGLMSKPMVVTLPFVLLLLDFWPLERLSRSTVKKLFLEKLPFFALAAAGSVATYLAQKGGGAVWSAGLPISLRLENALVSYSRYLARIFWPADLAVIYPYPRHWPAVQVFAALALLVLTTTLLWRRARRNPYALFGWLWFLGMLVPVIGLVQVGPQAMADRFTYLPAIGLFILIAWTLNDLAEFRPPRWRRGLILAGTAALSGCVVVTHIQLSYWQDGITLLRHAVDVTTDNYVADNFLGRALDNAGQKDESLPLYETAVRLEPNYAQARFNLGMARFSRQQWNDACVHLAAAVHLAPENAGARYYFGTALLENGRFTDAIAQLNEAIHLDSHLAAAHYQLGRALQQLHQPAETVAQYREALKLTPDFPEARAALEHFLAEHQDLR